MPVTHTSPRLAVFILKLRVRLAIQRNHPARFSFVFDLNRNHQHHIIRKWVLLDSCITRLMQSCYQLLSQVSGVRAVSRPSFSPSFFTERLVICSHTSRPDLSTISEPTLNSLAKRYLDAGESILDIAQATAVNSRYFTRDKR